MSTAELLIKKHFEQNSIVKANIDSFNKFIDSDFNAILEENKIITPTIIPPNVDSFFIRLDKIWITKPEITEADGSKRPIYPIEARLRKLSYSSPIFIEVSAHINGVQRESIQVQVGNLPIMLKSDQCHLSKLSREELIAKGEDPADEGGYFIINGTERVIVNIEDLAANRVIVESTSGTVDLVAKMFSEQGAYKIPHTMEKLKDGIFYLTFTRAKRVPLVPIIKALGVISDEEIMKMVSEDKQYDEVLVNLLEHVSIKNAEDAMDWVAKKIGITQTREIRLERVTEILDKYLFPHVGVTPEHRVEKAYNLCKMLRKYIMALNGEIKLDDKDHYMNKRIKRAGDLLGDLFRMNLKVLINDILYNFQRLVKRGKFPSIKIIIRDKLLTQRIYSAMATGNWVGGRKGISQRIQRLNYLNVISSLQRVVSPLSSSQENFLARELHATHLGRLCPSETPEGTNIGLRKNFALLTSVTDEVSKSEILPALKQAGLREKHVN